MAVVIITSLWFLMNYGFTIAHSIYLNANPLPSAGKVTNYTLDNSEGDCSKNIDCEWAGDACGGGHGICTNNPNKYNGMASICDINNEFPANKGYTCSCIQSIGKCGWIK